MKKTLKRTLATFLTVIMIFSAVQFGMVSLIAIAATEELQYYYEVIDDHSPVRKDIYDTSDKLGEYNKGKLIAVYKVRTNSYEHDWVKVHYKNSEGKNVAGYIYSEHCRLLATVKSTSSKNIETIKSCPIWDRPCDKNTSSYAISSTISSSQVFTTIYTLKNIKGNIWYRVKDKAGKNGFIYDENVKAHTCKQSSATSTSYSNTNADTHDKTVKYRKCSYETCQNYSTTVSKKTTESHKFVGGICDDCGYEYKLTIDDANRKYRVTDTNEVPVYSRPYKHKSEKYGPLAYGTTIKIDAKTINEEKHIWYRISSGTYSGKWIWDEHLTRVYTITYNANGGSNTPAATEFLEDNSAKITSSVPTRSGYTFKGWATSASSTTVAYKAGDKYSTQSSTTLYAVWQKVSTSSYTVTYNANGGSVSPSSVTVTSGKSTTLPTPTKSYTITYNANGGSGVPSSQSFKASCSGWSTSSSATSANYSCGASFTPKGNTTLYAVWNSVKATISSTIPTRTGYNFLGWSTSSTASSPTYSAGITSNFSSSVTLYAVWNEVFSSVKASFTDGKTKGSTLLSFNPSWFSKDSINYNHNIARLASQFAMLGYSKKDGSELRKALESIGFSTDLKYINLDTKRDQQNYFIAKKDMLTDGKKYTLVFVGLIGSHNKQWDSDFDPWGKGREQTYATSDNKNYTHLGFADSREFVYSALDNYFRSEKLSGDIKLLITGHSRGAAAANLLGAKLIKEGSLAGKSVSKSNIYTYTFATPNVTKLSEIKNTEYNRIFNFVNPEDFVTKVLPVEWGFGRYGKTFTLPSRTNSIDAYYNLHYLPDMQKFYNDYRVDVEKNKPYDYKPYANGEEPVYNIVQKLTSSVKNLDEFYSKKIGTVYLMDSLTPYEFFSKTLCPFVNGSTNNNDAIHMAVSILMDDPKGKSLYGSVIYYFIEHQNGIICKSFEQAHEAETYCAFLMSLSENEATKDRSSYKNSVNCPVDIEVYDKLTGELVGRIKNNTVDEKVSSKDNAIVMVVDGDSKQFWLPSDGNYDVKLTGNDKGTMDYTVATVNSDSGETNRSNFFDVALTKGLSMTGTISSNNFSTDNYTLKKTDGTVIKPTQKTSDIKDVKITTSASGNGYVTESLTAKSGDYVTVSAVAKEKNIFVGWYLGNKLVCNKKEYSFVAKNNVSLSAKFEEQSMSVEIYCADLNYRDSYTIKPEITIRDGLKYKVNYESSDTSVAIVNDSGEVQAVGRGYAKITCTVTDEYGNEAKATCNVTVNFQWWQWLIWIFLFGFLWYQ